MNVFALLLALAAPYNNDLPPVKYRHNPVASVVVIVNDTNTKEACGVAQSGWRLVACEREDDGVPVIMIDNPCLYPEAADPQSFAHRMCHEFGHANGWNADHNN